MVIDYTKQSIWKSIICLIFLLSICHYFRYEDKYNLEARLLPRKFLLMRGYLLREAYVLPSMLMGPISDCS